MADVRGSQRFGQSDGGRRRGGALDHRPGQPLADIRALRRKGVREGTWPQHSVADWRGLAQTAADLHRRGISPSPLGLLALDMFPEYLHDPEEESTWP